MSLEHASKHTAGHGGGGERIAERGTDDGDDAVLTDEVAKAVSLPQTLSSCTYQNTCCG